MTSRKHAQQAVDDIAESELQPFAGQQGRFAIVLRHIAAALAEQRDELFEYAASNLWHGVQRKLSSPRRSERMLDRAAAVKWLRGQKVALPAPPAKGEK